MLRTDNLADRPRENVIPLPRRVMSDEDLVAGLRAGDQAAGRALVERFHKKVSRRVHRMLGPDRETADIVQQVFAQVVHGLSGLAAPRALEDWVGRVTVNAVRGELRRRSYRRLVGFSTDTVEAAYAESDPDAALALSRGLEILNKLDPEAKILFVLRFIEGAELREICEVTGLAPATAKRRIAKARDAFLKKVSRDPMTAHWVQGELP